MVPSWRQDWVWRHAWLRTQSPSATINPVDQHIVGLKGRAAVLRSVASTIGLDGEEIVPPEDQIEKMEQAQQQQQQSGGVDQAIQQAVQKGVAAGVTRISTELTAGVLATRAHMPEGPPAHIGTPGSNPSGPATNNPAMDLGQAAAHGQGTKVGPQAGGGMSPQVANLVGNSKGPGGKPISPGVG